MRKITIRIIFCGYVVLLSQGCAKIGRPTGGPQDFTPPVYLSSEPDNRATSFNDDEITVLFDEFIQLKNQNDEILISPPMKRKPLVRVREKSLRITFDEKPIKNTTYTINFGKSLSDINEGNVLPDFEFVFSTGKIVDSLSVTGTLMNSFTNKTDEKAVFYVMLYDNLSDSAPFLQVPKYYSKANNFGLFAVNNIHPDTFRVIALEDINSNLKYDKGIERIAFLDSLLVINTGNVSRMNYIKDTIKIISHVGKPVKGKHDTTTVKSDTIISGQKILNARNVLFRYFLELDDKLFLKSRNRDTKEKFTLVFNRPLYKYLEIKPLNFKTDSAWYLLESPTDSDSLTYWITDTTIIGMDTLDLQLNYLTADSSGIILPRVDTVKLKNQLPTIRGGRNANPRRMKNNEIRKDIKENLKLTSRFSGKGILDLNSYVDLLAEKPVKSMDINYIELTKLVDSVRVNQPFTLKTDTQNIKKFRVTSLWDEDTQYKLLFKPGAVFDIYGVTNDSVEIEFITQKEDYYGKVLLNFSSPEYPMVIQVLDLKSNVISSTVAESDGQFIFDFLPPGQYSLKAIDDANRNGKWDTGNYLKKKQPEKVFLSPINQKLRSNWDIELTWNLNKN
jgi:hypothetical protein